MTTNQALGVAFIVRTNGMLKVQTELIYPITLSHFPNTHRIKLICSSPVVCLCFQTSIKRVSTKRATNLEHFEVFLVQSQSIKGSYWVKGKKPSMQVSILCGAGDCEDVQEGVRRGPASLPLRGHQRLALGLHDLLISERITGLLQRSSLLHASPTLRS